MLLFTYIKLAAKKIRPSLLSPSQLLVSADDVKRRYYANRARVVVRDITKTHSERNGVPIKWIGQLFPTINMVYSTSFFIVNPRKPWTQVSSRAIFKLELSISIDVLGAPIKFIWKVRMQPARKTVSHQIFRRRVNCVVVLPFRNPLRTSVDVTHGTAKI